MNLNDIEELKSDQAYPHSIKNVTTVETHISWVLLTGDIVYKIKKPVKFPFLDFSTFELRKHYCHQEIELNRRFSPEIYIDVVPITKSKTLNFKGEGKIVDHAVKMRQLPENSRMDVLLTNNKVTKQDIEEIADILYRFHSKTNIIKDRSYCSPKKIQTLIDHFELARDIIRDKLMMEEVLDEILYRCKNFVEKNSAFLISRQTDGFVKACHGDLHSKNVFITDKPHLTDCIEFNNDMSYVDIVKDIGFLATDLDARGRPDLSDYFAEQYLQLSKDNGIIKLLPFYKSWMANVRTRVTVLNIKQLTEKKRIDELLEEARLYLKLCHKYSEEL